MNKSLALRYLLGTVVLGALGVAAYRGIWKDQIAPLMRDNAWIQRKEEFATLRGRSDVLFISAKDNSMSLVFAKRTFQEHAESSITSIFDKNKPLIDKNNYDFFGVTSPTEYSNGVTAYGGRQGELVGEGGEVFEKFFYTEGNKKDELNGTIKIVECDVEKMTANVVITTDIVEALPCVLKGMSKADWAKIQHEHQSKYNDLAARRRDREEKIQAEQERQAQADREKTEKEAKEFAERQAAVFAVQSRAIVPLGQSVKLTVELDNSDESRVIKERHDDVIVIGRTTKGDNYGGAEYIAEWHSGWLTLIDSMTEQTLSGTTRRFILKDAKGKNSGTGWSSLKIDPANKEISGEYTSETSFPGFTCAYVTHWRSPKVVNIDMLAPAYRSELKVGDHIDSINGHSVWRPSFDEVGNSLEELEKILADAGPTITLKIEREITSLNPLKELFETPGTAHLIVTFDRERHIKTTRINTSYSMFSDSNVPIARGVPINTPPQPQIAPTPPIDHRHMGVVDDGKDPNTILRETPSASPNSKILDHIPNGEIVQILEDRTDGWLSIARSTGQIGFIGAKNCKARDETAHAQVETFVYAHFSKASFARGTANNLAGVIDDYPAIVEYYDETITKDKLAATEKQYFDETTSLSERIQDKPEIVQTRYNLYRVILKLLVNRVTTTGENKTINANLILDVRLMYDKSTNLPRLSIIRQGNAK